MLFSLGLLTILPADKYHFIATSATKRFICRLTLIYNLTTDTMQEFLSQCTIAASKLALVVRSLG
jgi:hypothetical protein